MARCILGLVVSTVVICLLGFVVHPDSGSCVPSLPWGLLGLVVTAAQTNCALPNRSYLLRAVDRSGKFRACLVTSLQACGADTVAVTEIIYDLLMYPGIGAPAASIGACSQKCH